LRKPCSRSVHGGTQEQSLEGRKGGRHDDTFDRSRLQSAVSWINEPGTSTAVVLALPPLLQGDQRGCCVALLIGELHQRGAVITTSAGCLISAYTL